MTRAIISNSNSQIVAKYKTLDFRRGYAVEVSRIHFLKYLKERVQAMFKIVQQTYLEQVTEDVTNYIKDNFTEDIVNDFCGEWEDFIDHLEDELWLEDSVTGNASGSYWFSRALAETMVLSQIGEVKFALLEYDMLDQLGRMMLEEEWERIDVITRCHQLRTAIYDALEQLGWYKGDF